MDPKTEVRYLFRTLDSWRETSQREFSNIINAHSSSINKGITHLVEEVSDLKAQLTISEKERNRLLETVNNLTDENRQLQARLPIELKKTQSEGNHNHITQNMAGL